MEDFLQETYYNNTVQAYFIAAGIILVGVILVRIFRKMMLRRLKAWAEKTSVTFDDLVVDAIERFGLPILNFMIFYWGISTLEFPDKVNKAINVAIAVVIAFFLIRLASTAVRVLLRSYVRQQENGEEKVKQLAGIMLIINICIWGIGLVFLFDNLGYDVTAIVAGLGIGGIAIALAAQNILGDLFNYFVIFFDRPFEIGDFIIVDSKMGTVEHIGIKTTRVKSLSGEQLVFSNSDLTNSRIHNYKRMQRRRIVFTVGVIYQTSKEQLKEIPGIIKAAIEKQSNTTFDRSHFSSYGDFSLNFETVYYVESSEYNVYMDTHQAINMILFEEFAARGIEFAYPTQTLFLTREQKEEAN